MANVKGVRSGNGAEDGGVRSSATSISERADWIVRVEEELLRRKNEKVLREQQYMFFRVPKPLLNGFQHFYIPDMVSIGPHHFGKPWLRSMEAHKVEAMCRMESRIQKVYPQRTLKSIVEREIMAMEKWIRDCYEEEIPYSPIELAWMATGDACFIYEFILCYCRYVKLMDVEEQWIHEAKYDSVFDCCRRSPTRHRILSNLLLFENQIPLSILEFLVEMAIGSQEALQEKFLHKWLRKMISKTSVTVFTSVFYPPTMKGVNLHLLGVSYYASVGDPKFYFLDAYEEPQLSYSLLGCLENQIGHIKTVFTRCLGSRFSESSSIHANIDARRKLPSATVLKKKGVRFHCVPFKHGFSPIQCVRFDEKTSTLRLPQVYVDDFRISLMRNFIALEATNAMYDPYPMTNFAILMNELIDNAEDCRLLSEAGIIANSLGSDQDVANAFNSLTPAMGGWLSTCKSTNNARTGLQKEKVQDFVERVLFDISFKAVARCWTNSCNPSSPHDGAAGRLLIRYLQSQTVLKTTSNKNLYFFDFILLSIYN